jgi:hypothetical protein
MAVAWNQVTPGDVQRAIEEYDRLGPDAFFAAHGFAPTTTYDLVRGGAPLPAEGDPGHRLRVRHRAAPCLR